MAGEKALLKLMKRLDDFISDNIDNFSDTLITPMTNLQDALQDTLEAVELDILDEEN